MRRWLAVGAIWTGLSTACGRGEGDDLVRLAEQCATEVCACPDAACAERRAREYVRAAAERSEAAAALGKSQQGHIKDALARLMGCLRDRNP